MSAQNFEQWLDGVLPRHDRLTQAVATIVENVLRARQIDFLAISGRTKTREGALEKIKRKNYHNPPAQLRAVSVFDGLMITIGD